MCGRFVQYSAPEVYASDFALESLCEAQARYNVAPTQSVLAIRTTDQGRRELTQLRWGLVPAWSQGPDSRFNMINARAETVSTKPAYRAAFKARRCLIPAEGFFEWQAVNGGKTPFLIRRKDQAPFAMAGLWELWHGADGADLASCTIIVTDANALVRQIHDRMPVVLGPESYAAWLDPGNRDAEGLLALLTPADPDPWTLHPVSRQVNSPRNDTPELLNPVEASGPA
jgi:putative SOS response-associated peptidase YedK